MHYNTITAFIKDNGSRLPNHTPGGAVGDAGDGLLSDADLFLCELASMVKEKATKWERVELLQRKARQINNQRHFNKEEDFKICDRLANWIEELMHEGS